MSTRVCLVITGSTWFRFFLCCVSYPLRLQLGGSVTEIPPVPPGTPSATPRLPSGIPHPVVGHASVGVWAELPATPSYSCTYPPLDAVPLDAVVTRVTIYISTCISISIYICPGLSIILSICIHTCIHISLSLSLRSWVCGW